MTDTPAHALFDARILPLRQNEALRLDWALDLVDGSYFRPAVPPVLEAEDMTLSAADNLGAQLTALWAGEADLLTMIPDITAMAVGIAEEQAAGHATGPDAPSTLVYQMW